MYREHTSRVLLFRVDVPFLNFGSLRRKYWYAFTNGPLFLGMLVMHAQLTSQIIDVLRIYNEIWKPKIVSYRPSTLVLNITLEGAGRQYVFQFGTL